MVKENENRVLVNYQDEIFGNLLNINSMTETECHLAINLYCYHYIVNFVLKQFNLIRNEHSAYGEAGPEYTADFLLDIN